MNINYSIAIDRNHDGNFNSEISGQVIELSWQLGMKQAYDSLADISWARISVRNPRGEFSPERTPLASGTRVRIQSDDGEHKRTHFTGVISQIEPDEGSLSRKQALIHLQDIQPWLEANPARATPQIDVTADQVIAALLAPAVIRPAIIAGFCLIDVKRHNLIDSVRIFPPQNLAQNLQAGRTRFAYVGDWWRASTSIREAIGEIVASERGRFYVDREGELVFLNRHHTLIHQNLAGQFDDDMSGMAYSYGDQRLNRLSLLMRPREIGESDTLLWQLPGALRIEPRSESVLNLRLVDERDQPLGLLAVDRLESRFQRTPEDGDHSVREDVTAEVTALGTTSVEVGIINHRRDAVNLALLRLYGKPLYRRDPLEIVKADGEGMYLYGLIQLALDLPALSDFATAQAFATYEVARRKHPRGTVRSLQLNLREHPQVALSATLFDRIRISETQTGHGARDYFIIGEEHQVSAAGTQHQVTWALEPADSTRFVIVDYSLIGNSAEVLAPF